MQLGDLVRLEPGAIGAVLLRTTVVYFALLLGLRLAGKRELGQMTAFDLVVVLVISNAVQNAMVGPDTSLSSGLLAAGTLLLVNWGVNRVGIRWVWLGRRVVGTPTVLISHGEFVEAHLRREGLEREQVMMALREHGVEKFEQAELAVLEVDGTISVVPIEGGVVHRTRRRVRGRKPAG